MHPLCYYRIDNIDVEPQPPSKWEIECQDLIARVPAMRHAELDEVEDQVFRLRHRTKRRDVLVQRRATLISMLHNRIRRLQIGAMNEARRARFIGPLTIQMRNGHPF
jgi:hypothetical protein